jgi:YHS domain-containing protein
MGDTEVPSDGEVIPPVEPLDEGPRIMARDPVCGGAVDPATAAASLDHAGIIYYFCTLSCRDDFQADPVRYVGD